MPPRDPRGSDFIFTAASLSTAIQTREVALAYLIVPPAFTGDEITIQCSEDGATWFDLWDEALNEWRICVPQPIPNGPDGIMVNLMLPDFAANTWMRLRSGFAATPNVETVTITPGFRNIDS